MRKFCDKIVGMVMIDIIIILFLITVNIINFLKYRRYPTIFWVVFGIANFFNVLSIISLILIFDTRVSILANDIIHVLILSFLLITFVTMWLIFAKKTNYDQMTGIKNRCAFEFALKNYKPKSKKFGVLFLDIDDLKETNDKYGHKEGDKLIKLITKLISSALKDNAYFFRIGGDEFVAFIDSADEKELISIKNKIISDIEKFNKIHNTTHSISTGYHFIDANTNLEKAVRLADDKMYAEKEEKKRRKN